MRLLREWNGDATADETWKDPKDVWIQLEEEDMPDKLMHALPDLGWKVEGGVVHMRPWHAYIIWGRCVHLPEEEEQDDEWASDGYNWIAWDINPATAFGRFWPALAARMTEEDWTTTTPGAFAIRLRLLAKKLLQPIAPEALQLTSKDFIPIQSPYHHEGFRNEVAWSEAMLFRFQWVKGIKFSRSSLADRNGELTAWRKLAQFIGSRYGVDACKAGSVYLRTLAELTTWLLKKSPDSIKGFMRNISENLAPEKITSIAGYFSASIRNITGFPLHLDAHLQSAEEKMQFLQDHLIFYSADPSNTLMAELFNRYAFNIIALSPTLAMLLGKDEAAWPYQLPQMLSELDPKQGDYKLDVAIIGRVEAWLKLKIPLIKELCVEHEFDVGARLAGVLGGNSNTSQPSAPATSMTAPSTTVDVIMGADADTSSFVKMAKDFKNSCSYVGIKRDVIAARSNPDYSQPQILSIMLNGRTVDEPNRRTNAITLAQLFLKAKGIRGIDPDMSFAPLMLEQSFPELLGRKCMKALNYPLKAVRLEELANMITKIGCLADKPQQFNLMKLALIPCSKVRFGGAAPDLMDRPYASMEGIELVIDVFAAVFNLLGVDDDKGEARVPPMSPRSLMRTCFDFLKKYKTREPKLTATAVESIILGSVGQWFKTVYDPARTAMNVTLTVPKYFIQQADANLAGLNQVEKAIEAKLQRDLEDRVDLAAIPAVAALKLGSSDDDDGTSSSKQSKTEQGKDHDKKRKRDDNDKSAGKEKKPQDREWRETAELRISEEGDVFHVGDTAYNVKQMQKDLAADGKFSAGEVASVNFPALVMARVIPARTKEAERLAPDKEIKFGRGNWPSRWKEIFDFIKLNKYKVDNETKERKNGRGKGGSGSTWKGGGKTAAAAVVATANITEAARPSRKDNQSTSTTANSPTAAAGTTGKGQGMLLLLMGGLIKSHDTVGSVSSSIAAATTLAQCSQSAVPAVASSAGLVSPEGTRLEGAALPRSAHELTWLRRLREAEAEVARPRQQRPAGRHCAPPPSHNP